MYYHKLGEDVYIPEPDGFPLKNVKDIKFNYYLSSRINGNLIDVDITSKLFARDKMFVRKSCYRLNIGEIENCVKANTMDHMKSLGVDDENIPSSLKSIVTTNRYIRNSPLKTYTD